MVSQINMWAEPYLFFFSYGAYFKLLHHTHQAQNGISTYNPRWRRVGLAYSTWVGPIYKKQDLRSSSFKAVK